MSNYNIKYTPIAVDDMDEAFSYISNDNVAEAKMMLEKIDQRIKRLAQYPFMGTILSEEDYLLIKQSYRFIIIHPYIVFYRVIDDNVIIHRILHGRRDYLRELFSELLL